MAKKQFIMGTHRMRDGRGQSFTLVVIAETEWEVLACLSLRYPTISPRQWDKIDVVPCDEPVPDQYRLNS